MLPEARIVKTVRAFFLPLAGEGALLKFANMTIDAVFSCLKAAPVAPAVGHVGAFLAVTVTEVALGSET